MTKSRECGTKQRLTKDQAKQKASWWRHARFARMEAYKCKYCGFYHVGNRRVTKRRRTRG